MYGLSAKKSGRSREVPVSEGLTIKPFLGKICVRDTVCSKKQLKKKYMKTYHREQQAEKKSLVFCRKRLWNWKNIVLWTHRVLSIEDIEYIVLLIVHIGYFHLNLPLPIVNFPTERTLQAEISLFDGKRTLRIKSATKSKYRIRFQFSVF